MSYHCIELSRAAMLLSVYRKIYLQVRKRYDQNVGMILGKCGTPISGPFGPKKWTFCTLTLLQKPHFWLILWLQVDILEDLGWCIAPSPLGYGPAFRDTLWHNIHLQGGITFGTLLKMARVLKLLTVRVTLTTSLDLRLRETHFITLFITIVWTHLGLLSG